MWIDRWLMTLMFLGALAASARADIHRWDTGQVIPGTEGIRPGPSLQLSEWDGESHNLRYGDFSGGLDLALSSFRNSWLDHALFTGANLRGVELSGSTLTHADLSNAVAHFPHFRHADLTGANLSNALLHTSSFTGASLANANLTGADLYGSTLSGANLAGANLRESSLAAASVGHADMRGAVDANTSEVNSRRNTILPNGVIEGLDLYPSDLLVIRDEDGVSDPPPAEFPWLAPRPPIAITIEDQLMVRDGGLLRLVIEDDRWNSLITFESGIPVRLGGTLDVTFAANVDASTQVGRTLHLFDWTGVDAMAQFRITSAHAWDLSRLYTTGEIELIALPGDFDGDGRLSAADIDALAISMRTADPESIHDLTGDGAVDVADHTYWVHSLKHTTLGDANLDGAFNSTDLIAVLAAGEYEDTIANNSGWATGDWDADGEFATADLVAALADGGYGPRPAAAVVVPEPCGALLLTLAMLGLSTFYRPDRRDWGVVGNDVV
jgi:uncharacterized protein YjbI with pentapeptide repeats